MLFEPTSSIAHFVMILFLEQAAEKFYLVSSQSFCWHESWHFVQMIANRSRNDANPCSPIVCKSCFSETGFFFRERLEFASLWVEYVAMLVFSQKRSNSPLSSVSSSDQTFCGFVIFLIRANNFAVSSMDLGRMGSTFSFNDRTSLASVENFTPWIYLASLLT